MPYLVMEIGHAQKMIGGTRVEKTLDVGIPNQVQNLVGYPPH